MGHNTYKIFSLWPLTAGTEQEKEEIETKGKEKRGTDKSMKRCSKKR